MVTRDEVARAAGTSSAVVSYVMNGGPRPVADATRQRVLKAVAELGYRPNAVARALRTATSSVIGLLLPNVTNPFFAELALAIEQAAGERGYALFLGNTLHEDERQAGYLRAFAEHQVRGILMVGAASGPRGGIPAASRAALLGNTLPVVFLDRVPRALDGVTLVVDNRDGACRATRHLIDHGHRSIGVLGGPGHLSSVRQRNGGWRQALTEAGIDPGEQLNVTSSFDRYECYGLARRLLTMADRPTGLFVHSDEQAIGVLNAAAASNVRVPADLAVVSFDGIRESALTRPPLTTVQQPLDLVAARAVGLLVAGVAGVADGAAGESETLPVRLVVRESCGCSADHASADQTPVSRRPAQRPSVDKPNQVGQSSKA